jgi:hypothetical protein
MDPTAKGEAGDANAIAGPCADRSRRPAPQGYHGALALDRSWANLPVRAAAEEIDVKFQIFELWR